MATKMFVLHALSDMTTGQNYTDLRGTANQLWTNRSLSTTAAASLQSGQINTVAGPTAGVEYAGAVPYAFISPPLAADVTVSGSITWNIWASESIMSANVAVNGVLEKIDGATGNLTNILTTTNAVEAAITTRAVNNFSASPGAGVLCHKGDRFRVRIFADDAGTMGSGFTTDISYNASTGGADGDTWVQLTETVTFASEPAGSQVFLTNTASPVSTASVDREAWTSRGAGVQTDATSTVTGPTAPIQVTDTAGGTVVDWFTRQLNAITIGGAVRVNARASVNNVSSGTVIGVEIAEVTNTGTLVAVWAMGAVYVDGGLTTSETLYSFLIGGADLAVSGGDRLRIRLYIDDSAGRLMVTGSTCTIWYAGTSGGASGDFFVTFTNTLVEGTGGSFLPSRRIYPPFLAQ